MGSSFDRVIVLFVIKIFPAACGYRIEDFDHRCFTVRPANNRKVSGLTAGNVGWALPIKGAIAGNDGQSPSYEGCRTSRIGWIGAAGFGIPARGEPAANVGWALPIERSTAGNDGHSPSYQGCRTFRIGCIGTAG